MISVVFVLGPGTVLLQFRSNRQSGSKIQRLTNISVGGKSGREKILVLEIISYGQIRKLKKSLPHASKILQYGSRSKGTLAVD